MDRWVGRVALVTGASEGIGEAVAAMMVENGMKVVGCARNKEKLSAVATKVNKLGKGEMFPYKCDVGVEGEILGMFEFIKEKFGTLHCCINNAAIIYDTSILEGKTSPKYVKDFLDFMKSVMTKVLKDELMYENFYDNATEELVSQTYDRAAVMAGTLSGVQSMLKSHGFKHPHFIHCYAHNLAVLSKSAEKEWSHMFQVNVIGLLVCTREAVKLMRATGVDDGHIIHMNSVAGHRIVHKPLYGTTKHAVNAINQGLRLELIEAGSHIRSSQISPGFVETYLLDKVYPGQGKCEKLFSQLDCIKSEDIADSVRYILALPPYTNVNDIIIRPTMQAE